MGAVIEETTWLFLWATVALVAYSLFAVAFYRTMQAREPGADVADRVLRRRGWDDDRRDRFRWWWRVVAVPGAVCAFAIVLTVLSVGIIDDREAEDTYAVAAAVLAAVRILAFAWREPAHELAKMVPVAVLSVALISGSSIDPTEWRQTLAEAGAENAWVYLIGLVLLEWMLQFGVPRVRAVARRGG